MSSTRLDIRLLAYRILVIAGVLVLGSRLWDLQIVREQEFSYRADRNRFRLVTVDAPRGIIYDREGRIVARNAPSFTISIVPAVLPDGEAARDGVFDRLAILMETSGEAEWTAVGAGVFKPGVALPEASIRSSIEESFLQNRGAPYTPVPVATNVDRQVAFLVEEEHLNLPGVVVQVEALRYYPYGPSLSHVLGYAGYMPAELADHYLNQSLEDYQIGDRVGLTGVELVCEEELRGLKGRKHVEVDVYEHEVNLLAEIPPSPGYNVILTIDVDFQQVVEAALREGMRAAREQLTIENDAFCRSAVAVAMNPQTGEILAMVSLPSYDDNLFSGRISAEDLAQLHSDSRRPLVNHAIGGQYPPGSTFKPFVAAGALQEGIVTVGTEFTCEGTLLLPNKYFPDNPELAQTFHCWKEQGHGSLNVVEAIQHSCDIFFYQLAGGYEEFGGLGVEKLGEYVRLFGYGEPTGIDLPGESSGLVAGDRWKRQNYGESWVTGDTYNAAIGQGFVLATPLQVLNSTAAIASYGTLYRPQVVYRVENTEGQTVRSFVPEVIREILVDQEYLSLIRQGMRDAVTHGTAWLLDMPEIAVAGKTGTAEYPAVDEEGNLIRDEDGYLPTHAWFTAFAPFDDPEIALVVFVEGGGEGSQVAVPIAGNILRHYFGLPEALPTPPPELPVVQPQ